MTSKSVQFRCPSCNNERPVNRKVLGRRVRCPECSHVSRVEENVNGNGESEPFDAYYHWLAIPPGEQPPNYYRLLGVAPFEPDPDVIAMSADRQMLHIKAQSSGRYGHDSQNLLNELAKARACLLDRDKRPAYDDELRKQLGSSQTAGTTKTASPAKKKKKSQATRNEPQVAELEPLQATRVATPPEPKRNGAPRPSAASQAAGEPPDQDPVLTFGGDKDDSESEMDMTPMVDVTFLLLIFFMVTAAFTLQKTIPMPAESQDPSTNPVDKEEDDPDIVHVFVDSLNTYYVRTADWEEEAPSEHEMVVKLRQASEGSNGDKPSTLLIRAHGDALYEKVIAVMDAGSEFEFRQMNVMMTEEDEVYD